MFDKLLDAIIIIEVIAIVYFGAGVFVAVTEERHVTEGYALEGKELEEHREIEKYHGLNLGKKDNTVIDRDKKGWYFIRDGQVIRFAIPKRG